MFKAHVWRTRHQPAIWPSLMVLVMFQSITVGAQPTGYPPAPGPSRLWTGPAPALPAAADTWLSGRVVDAQGHPLPGARVSVMNQLYPTPDVPAIPSPADGRMIMGSGAFSPAITDQDGQFRLRLDPRDFQRSKFLIFARAPQQGLAQHGPALFTNRTTASLAAGPLVLQPAVRMKVELYAEDPIDTEKLKSANISLMLRPPVVRGMGFSRVLMSPVYAAAVSQPVAPLRYEFPALIRGVPLTLVLMNPEWACGEPVLLENDREIGRGPVTMPEKGQPAWVLKVPIRQGRSGSPYPSMPARPTAQQQFLFRDALTGKPVPGVGLSRTFRMNQGTTETLSDPDGVLNFDPHEFPPGNIALDECWQPIAAKPGFVAGRTILLPRNSGGLPWVPVPIELTVMPALEGKRVGFSFIDGLGHPVTEGVTILDGPMRWRTLDTQAFESFLEQEPSAEAIKMRVRRPWDAAITVSQWRTGKALFYFQTEEGGTAQIRLAENQGDTVIDIPGVRAVIDEKGHACLEVAFEALNASNVIIPVQLIDSLNPSDNGAPQ